jgi:hypothetical protein
MTRIVSYAHRYKRSYFGLQFAEIEKLASSRDGAADDRGRVELLTGKRVASRSSRIDFIVEPSL